MTNDNVESLLEAPLNFIKSRLAESLLTRIKAIPRATEGDHMSSELSFVHESLATGTLEELEVLWSGLSRIMLSKKINIPLDRNGQIYRELNQLEALDVALSLIENEVIMLVNLNSHGLGSIMQLGGLVIAPSIQKALESTTGNDKLTIEQFYKFQVDVISCPLLAGRRWLAERLPDGEPKEILKASFEKALPIWHEIQANPHPYMGDQKEREKHEQRWSRLRNMSLNDMIRLVKAIDKDIDISNIEEIMPYIGIFVEDIRVSERRNILTHYLMSRKGKKGTKQIITILRKAISKYMS
jgi:hypothetical protein